MARLLPLLAQLLPAVSAAQAAALGGHWRSAAGGQAHPDQDLEVAKGILHPAPVDQTWDQPHLHHHTIQADHASVIPLVDDQGDHAGDVTPGNEREAEDETARSVQTIEERLHHLEQAVYDLAGGGVMAPPTLAPESSGPDSDDDDHQYELTESDLNAYQERIAAPLRKLESQVQWLAKAVDGQAQPHEIDDIVRQLRDSGQQLLLAEMKIADELHIDYSDVDMLRLRAEDEGEVQEASIKAAEIVGEFETAVREAKESLLLKSQWMKRGDQQAAIGELKRIGSKASGLVHAANRYLKQAAEEDSRIMLMRRERVA